MARSKLVCNLTMDNFFTLPDSSEVWRKKNLDPVIITDATGDNVKRHKAYECVSLYDSKMEIRLPGNQRVDLVD